MNFAHSTRTLWLKVNVQKNHHLKEKYLHEPNWKLTRSIYKRLSDEFHVLTGAYGIVLSDRQKLMLDHLILGIDEVDKSIDEIPSFEKREEVTQSLLKFLGDKEEYWANPLKTDSLTDKMLVLKKITQELKIENRFSEAVSEIFNYTEQKRHVPNEDELIELVMLEGKATAELPLSIMSVESNHSFAKFFIQLCTLMGIADLIVDAKSDYKSNYIVLKPKLELYLKLNIILIKEGVKIFWNFPKKGSFLLYCIRFSWLLMTSKD